MSAYVYITVGLLIIVAAVVVGLPTESQASTYGYVNSSGEVVYVVADSSAGAFTDSTNIAPTSGVILVTDRNDNMLEVSTEQLSGYMFVNLSGVVTQVSANNSADAFTNAIGRDLNSGVMLINSTGDSDMVGNQE